MCAMAQPPQSRRPGPPGKGTVGSAKKPGSPAAKPVTAKPPAASLSSDENAQTVQAEPVVTEEDIVADEAGDDELALQPNAPEEPADADKKLDKFRPIKRGEDLEGAPSRILDTTHYLVIAGAVVVILILGGGYYLFSGYKPLPEKKVDLNKTTAQTPSSTKTADTSGSSSAAKTSNSGATSAKTGTPFPSNTTETPAADYGSNARNRECFHGCMLFLMWSREAGLNWNSEQLTAKFKTDVKGTGVNDPEVLEVFGKIQNLFTTGLPRPMNPLDRTDFAGSGAHGARTVEGDAAVKKHNELMGRIRLLTPKLRKRYGDPSAEAMQKIEAEKPAQEEPKSDAPTNQPGATAPPAQAE